MRRLVHDLTIDASSCGQRVDLSLTLASRAPAAPPAVRSNAAPGRAPAGSAAAADARPAAAGRGVAPQNPRGRGGRAAAQPFESLSLRADDDALARADDASAAGESAAMLPPGFSPDSSSESVTSIGSTGGNATFFGPNGGGDFAERFANGDGPPGGAAGFGGLDGGGRGGARRIRRPRRRIRRAGGPFGRGGRGNQIRGSVFESVDSSTLDAAPFRSTVRRRRSPTICSSGSARTIGGPLVIPKLGQQPAHVLLPQLHRQPLAQSVRCLFDRADGRRARRRSVGARPHGRSIRRPASRLPTIRFRPRASIRRRSSC